MSEPPLFDMVGPDVKLLVTEAAGIACQLVLAVLPVLVICFRSTARSRWWCVRPLRPLNSALR